MMKKNEIVLIIGTIAFVALIISISLIIGNQMKPRTCGCPRVISHNFLWICILLAVIFVGSLLYYLFSLKIDFQKKMIYKNIDIIYTILDKEEKKLLQDIVDSKGEIEQNVLAKKYGKIKAHRIIKKLSEKKIIEKIDEGRTNVVKLNKFLKKELVK
jgi:hypothetical protein